MVILRLLFTILTSSHRVDVLELDVLAGLASEDSTLHGPEQSWLTTFQLFQLIFILAIVIFLNAGIKFCILTQLKQSYYGL